MIDLSGCLHDVGRRTLEATKLYKACTEYGFFYIVGHGIESLLMDRLQALSRQFFELPLAAKMQLRMELGGQAWRGYFPVGSELTSGQPDHKEGLYFGQELSLDHALVKAGTPLHGPNLFPSESGFKETVLTYMEQVTGVGHLLMRLVALSLKLKEDYFETLYTKDPLILFRIFHYPPDTDPKSSWGVGEHTDYGVLTILKQDDCGGLQVKTGSGWIEAPPVADSFVCNIGDMLDRMTGGLYLSTPHRVRNISGKSRYSFPLFFDPHFSSVVQPIFRERPPVDHQLQRWDQASVHSFKGTYGDYLLGKVAKVFPELKKVVLPK